MEADEWSQQDPDAIKAFMRIKLNDISVTMAHPVSTLDHVYQPPTPSAATSFPPGTLPTKVPVVRIFGTTPRNQSVCLNVHGIWPYFFVEYPAQRSLAPEAVHRYTHRLANALNSALCQSLRQDPYATNSKTGAGGINTSTLHVSSVLLCKGVPFYGYHVGYSYFLRISLVTPSHIYRAVNLLEGGSVMKNKFAVYESHLATKLQFMVDFDLYGCGWVDIEKAMFRQPLPPGDPYSADREGIYDDLTVNSSMLHPLNVGKDTWSQLEIDIVPWQILNRRRLRPRYLHDSLKELLFSEMFDPEEKYVRSVRELWKEESRRRVELNLPPEEGMVPATDERVPRSVPSQGDVGFKGGVWDSTEMWEQKLDDRIKAEEGNKKRNWELRNIGRPLPAALDPTSAGIWDKWIPTTFQVVETGWPKEMTSSRRTRTRGKGATQSSPLKARDPTQRPTLYEDEDDEQAEEDVDLEEGNPFTQLAASQRLPSAVRADLEETEVEEAIDDLDKDTVELIGTQSAKKWHESEERVEAEMQGFRERMDVTPSKPGSRNIEADPDLGDQEEMQDDDFVGHLTQMQSRRKTQANALDSPATASRRVRGELATPEPESPTRKGNNPYYTDSLPSTPGSSRNSTPRKNLFGRQRAGTPSPPHQPFAMGPKRTSGIPLSGPPPFNSPSKPVTPSKLRFVSTGQPLTLEEDEDDVFIASTARDKLVAAVRYGESAAARSGSSRSDTSDGKLGIPVMVDDLSGQDDDEVAPLAQIRPVSQSTSPPASIPRPSLLSPALAPHATPRKPPATSILKRPRRDLSDEEDGLSQLEPTLKVTQAKRARFAAESSSEEDEVMEPTYVSQAASRSTIGKSHASDPEVEPIRSSTEISGSSMDRPNRDVRDSGIVLRLSQNSASNESNESSEPSVTNTYYYAPKPPSRSHIEATIRSFGEVDIIYQKPFFSVPQDLPSTKSTYGTRTFQLRTNGLETLPCFSFGRETTRPGLRNIIYKRSEVLNVKTWRYTAAPPSRLDTARWLVEEEQLRLNDARHDTRQKLASQLGEPTQLKFRYSDRKKGSNAQRESQSLSCLTLEVFAPSRGRLLPDPKQDAIVAVFYCLQDSKTTMDRPISEHGYYTGVWIVESEKNRFSRLGNLQGLFVEYYESELELFNEIVDRVRAWDPDVLGGWEVHGSSWGFLAGRASEEFGMNLSDEFSRVRASTSPGGHSSWNVTQNSAFKVVGRHVFNIWRIMRGDLNLLGYTFENVAYHLLKQRFPRYSTSSLTSWYNSQYPTHVIKVLQYYADKTSMYMEMMDAAEICTKNAEFARVFGVDFNSAMTRGSQFKVESFMFRIAKPEGFVLISPSREAVGKQNAAECQPLIQEPPSAFYEDPVLVLDFQSLYPSIMIGYNYCYSTCLGRVDPFRGTYKLGWSAQHIPDGQIGLLKDHVTISPNGRIYAKQTLRKSLLAKMLREILDTRVMVKQGMKTSKGNKSLLQVLNARQLGLKLMANVTYGYTGASFSGRMPCVEIADDIVQTGRETLEKAIQYIESQHHWGARVIYGDTDSLFVLLEGRTIPQAFRIGNEMADQITARNPRPIKLKFEKVYTKCVLEAKKRYVGFKMESIDETPSFDAKGIETVRRDGCPAAQKMLENVLKLLFRRADLSEIKRYCIDEWTKILQGKISFQDLIISKEVKLGSYSENGLPPPGAVIAGRRLAEDPMDEAEYGERVPFIITKHGASDRLVHKARAPEDLLNDRNILPDTEYYITRQIIPPINRVLKLVGVDAAVWYAQMPRRHLVYDRFRVKDGKGKMGKTLDATWRTAHCLVCGVRCGKDQEVCEDCTSPPNLASSLHALSSRYHISTSRLLSIQRACASCASTAVSEHVKCESVDCPVLYARIKAGNEVQDTEGLIGVVNRLDKQERKGWEGEDMGVEVISLLDSDDE